MSLQKKGTTRTGSITQTPLKQQTNKPYLRLVKQITVLNKHSDITIENYMVIKNKTKKP